MAFYPASSSSPRQLSLDLDLEDATSAHSADSGVKRSVIFPKNIQIFNVPEFQRQVSQLFDPLNINIEFRVTRQNRLEMCWSYTFLRWGVDFQIPSRSPKAKIRNGG